jgi:hypothetical protein
MHKQSHRLGVSNTKLYKFAHPIDCFYICNHAASRFSHRTEGTGGDPMDGRFSLSVVGNQNHNIRVYDGQFNYPKTMYFERGVQKIINVEPGTTVYVRSHYSLISKIKK